MPFDFLMSTKVINIQHSRPDYLAINTKIIDVLLTYQVPENAVIIFEKECNNKYPKK